MSNPIKPDHYKSGKFDVIWFIQKYNLSFCIGNVVKYVTRAGVKDPTKTLEDLEKAKEYLQREINNLKSKTK